MLDVTNSVTSSAVVVVVVVVVLVDQHDVVVHFVFFSFPLCRCAIPHDARAIDLILPISSSK